MKVYWRSIVHLVRKVLDPHRPCGDAECVAHDLDDHGVR